MLEPDTSITPAISTDRLDVPDAFATRTHRFCVDGLLPDTVSFVHVVEFNAAAVPLDKADPPFERTARNVLAELPDSNFANTLTEYVPATCETASKDAPL